MVKIGVISDTHIKSNRDSLPGEIFNVFKDVDVIFHAGDICTREVIEELKALAPVIAVSGNMDSPNLAKPYQRKGINNKSFLIVHGHNTRKRTVASMKEYVDHNPDLDGIVFGHSHQPYNNMYKDVLLFNPGSPTSYKRPYIKKKEPSVGFLTIKEDQIEGEIVYLGTGRL